MDFNPGPNKQAQEIIFNRKKIDTLLIDQLNQNKNILG